MSHDTAPMYRSERFQQWMKYLRPIARRIAGRRALPHPELGRDDLMADAVYVCLKLWEKYHESKPDPDLVRMAVSAMDRRLRNRRRDALSYGEAEVQIVSLSSPAGRDQKPGATLADTVPVPDPQTAHLIPLERYRRTFHAPLRVGDAVEVVRSRVIQTGVRGEIVYCFPKGSKHYEKVYRIRLATGVKHHLAPRSFKRVKA